MGVFEDNDHKDEVECIEDNRDEKLHTFNVNRNIECGIHEVDGTHH